MANYRRRRRRRRSFNLRRVRVAANTTIGALTGFDVIAGDLTAASANAYRLMSINASYSLANLGATADDGQEFGVAHSDYTAAEIEQCLEAQGAIDVRAKIENEQANRLVRSIGQMTGAPGTGAGLSFNDGRPTTTKLNWAMGIGDKLVLWIRNGSPTIYTTGASIVTNGQVWIKDGL